MAISWVIIYWRARNKSNRLVARLLKRDPIDNGDYDILQCIVVCYIISSDA